MPVQPIDTPTATLDRIFEAQERFILRLPGEPRSDRREKPLSAARPTSGDWPLAGRVQQARTIGAILPSIAEVTPGRK